MVSGPSGNTEAQGIQVHFVGGAWHARGMITELQLVTNSFQISRAFWTTIYQGAAIEPEGDRLRICLPDGPTLLFGEAVVAESITTVDLKIVADPAAPQRLRQDGFEVAADGRCAVDVNATDSTVWIESVWPQLHDLPGWQELYLKLRANVAALDPHAKVGVKPKLGLLLFRVWEADPAVREQVQEVCRTAETESMQTCQACGGPGERIGPPARRWVRTLCAEHDAMPDAELRDLLQGKS